MKYILPATLALFGCASMAPAALVIHEDFNYVAGNLNGQAATGTGLSGSWATGGNEGGTPKFAIQASSLSFTGHFASSGGSLALTGTGNPNYGFYNASAQVSAALTGSSTLYASSLMTMNTAGTYYQDWVLEQRFNTTNAQGNTYGTSSARNLLSAYEGTGVSGSLPRNAGVSADASEVIQADSINAGTNYLFVTEYAITGSNVTSATLHVFDETAYGNYLLNSNMGNAAVNLGAYDLFTLTDTSTTALSNFAYLQYTLSGGVGGRMDDFRLGNEIADVVNVVPEPSAALLGGLGLLCLLRRRR